MFAKPLVAVLEGHTDSVNCMSTSRTRLCDLFTGSNNGEVRMFNLLKKHSGKPLGSHASCVNGICTNRDGSLVYSCGNDKYIKCWKLLEQEMLQSNKEENATTCNPEPVELYLSKSMLNGIDYNWQRDIFATAGDVLEIWDGLKSLPISKFEWGCDSLYCVKFNNSDVNLLASSGGDNSVGLYDIRANSPIRKLLLKLRSNAISWNPQNPINFTIANEDSNLYTFDTRNLKQALIVHKDFTNAVTDVDYSPTGTEFVACSFDKCIRLFDAKGITSRDIYSNRRMQNISSCRFSLDGRFVMSGSADMCVRIWKARASEPLRPKSQREKASLQYRNALAEKYRALPEIRRIQKHHHVPALVLKLKKTQLEKNTAKRRREINKALHSKDPKLVLEKEKPIIKQVE
ncbi:bifunctional WD40-repeat-containing domain superfamily/WD40 repeat/Sof1-like protein/WD40-YVTN repeat-like-containing domain superfamily [Babesia duncani]|uniref:Bifunctional WD40-repeat-containing domain superfamily/WD40 repeat/Sof1-like protein/WD40-YVTN repeat-like-containing domain superfamily n=1 Tax=Babesia duncani TaxID=323732 RepID=A0AAD9PLZ3_9APIC|nr:bifunctional WD40-repeat-containing domain superfamily/WD40 repeat/Sof1-like protein/WD40-YVTN repeat-like-containing domain superfamily [Babesia duncani]